MVRIVDSHLLLQTNFARMGKQGINESSRLKWVSILSVLGLMLIIMSLNPSLVLFRSHEIQGI